MSQTNKFATNQITDKFKRTVVRVFGATTLEAVQKHCFTLGFRVWISGDRTYWTDSNVRFVYIDENNELMFNYTRDTDPEYLAYRETTLFELAKAATEVKAIRKAKKKDQRKRKAAKAVQAKFPAADGWIANTGVKPTGKITAIAFRDGEIRTNERVAGGFRIDGGEDFSIPYRYNAGKTVSFYKLEQPKTVTLQAMMEDIVDAADGTEVQHVDKDGFISWAGGEMPVPEGTRVDVKFRVGYTNGDGTKDAVRYNLEAGEYGGAGIPFWKNDNMDNDIIAYRVCPTVTPAPVLGECQVLAPAGEPIPEPAPDTNPKKQYGLASIPLNMWSNLASAYGALALYNGSLKYGKANFANTDVEASIYIAAIKRHLASWEAGEEFDPADGVPHLGGVLANVAILLEARAAGTLVDDRLKMAGYLKERDALKALVPQIAAVHEGKNPRHYTIGG